MKTALCLVSLVVVLAHPAMTETIITDDITADTWWNPCGTPYVIRANVSVTGNSTLTIESSDTEAVTVIFDGDYYLETEWGSAIVATGNADHYAVFTSDAATPAQGDWKWIEVNGPNASSFTYCMFEYAEQGVRANYAAPTINYCSFRQCLYGLFCAGGSPAVQRCDIYANHAGIAISGSGATANPIINFNNIHSNTHWNVYVLSYGEPDAIIDAENNWWGTDEESAIAWEINDATDEPSVHATVDVDPWWSQQPVEPASWSRVKALFNE
ncbi:MAG: hypothetical protein JXB46_02450 [Candidatus Eisenbacteria bacterium]|nr:hypothetical protein [Candidatus Eisenbacteria bacterium]